MFQTFRFCVSLSVGLEPKKQFCMSEKNLDWN